MLINCPHCGKQLDAGPEKLGQVGTCPHCQGRFMVPMPTAEIASREPVHNPRQLPDEAIDPFLQESILFEHRPAVTQRAFEPAPDHGKIHVITERTSKRYKGMQILGIILFVFGLMLTGGTHGNNSQNDLSGPREFASLITMFGCILFIFARIQAWWHHG